MVQNARSSLAIIGQRLVLYALLPVADRISNVQGGKTLSLYVIG